MIILPLDVADVSTLEKKFSEVVARFGGVDILVNNAGVSSRSLMLDTHPAVEEKLMQCNYFGAIRLTRFALV